MDDSIGDVKKKKREMKTETETNDIGKIWSGGHMELLSTCLIKPFLTAT